MTKVVSIHECKNLLQPIQLIKADTHQDNEVVFGHMTTPLNAVFILQRNSILLIFPHSSHNNQKPKRHLLT